MKSENNSLGMSAEELDWVISHADCYSCIGKRINSAKCKKIGCREGIIAYLKKEAREYSKQ